MHPLQSLHDLMNSQISTHQHSLDIWTQRYRFHLSAVQYRFVSGMSYFRNIVLTCFASCAPSHQASWPFPGWMITWASVLILTLSSCVRFFFCSSSVKTSHPCSMTKSEMWIEWPLPFLWRGCLPSGTHTQQWYSLVWNVLSSWKIGTCSFPGKTVGNGSILFPSYSWMSLTGNVIKYTSVHPQKCELSNTYLPMPCSYEKYHRYSLHLITSSCSCPSIYVPLHD